MIDFSAITGLTIPEGSVKKITRKSDGAVLWQKSTTITFYINNQPYTALPDMTWGQWVGSEYDPFGCIVVNGKIYIEYNSKKENGTLISGANTTSLIEAEKAYFTMTM